MRCFSSLVIINSGPASTSVVSRGQTFSLLYLDGEKPPKYKRKKVWPRETSTSAPQIARYGIIVFIGHILVLILPRRG